MSNLATITNNILADSGIDDINVVVTNGSYANPAWITSLAWTKITGVPANIVTGSGTNNRIAKFNSTGATIGNSNISDDGSGVIVTGGAVMTSGWNRNTILEAVYPVLVYNSNGSKWAGIGYDWSFGFVLWANANSSNVVSGSQVLSIANSGATTIANLAGSGTRMVVADANGLLSTQAIGSGSITGSGTTNYLSKFTGSTTIGNSQIFNDGNNVGINTSTGFNQISGTETTLKIANTNAASLYLEVTGVRGYANFVGANGNMAWYDYTAAADRMILFSNGNFRVGTGSDNGARLQVSGGNVTITNSGNVLTTIRTTSNTGVATFYCQNDINTATEIGAWGSARAPFGAISANNGYIFSGDELAIGGSLGLKFGTGGSNTTRLTISSTGAATFSSSVTANNYVASGGSNTTVFNSASATTGWVQIAMNNTSGSALLGVEGAAAGTLATGTNAYASVLRNYTATDFQIATNNIVRTTITSSGNVGINTPTPIKMLQVYAGNGDGIAVGQNRVNDQLSANFFLYPTSLQAKKNWAISAFYTRATTLQFVYSNTSTSDPYFDGTPLMTLEGASGNVLIGTTTDNGARLQVSGTSSFSGELNLQYNNAIQTIQGNTGFSLIRLYGGNGSSSNVVEFQIRNRVDGGDFSTIGNFSNHDLQIRTNNTARLTIAASTGAATFSSSVTAASIASNNGGFRLKESSQTSSRNWIIGNDWLVYGDLAIGQSTTQTSLSYTYPIYINPSGNVGIGTITDGGYRLDVSGTIRSFSASPLVVSMTSNPSVSAIVSARWTSGVGMNMSYFPDFAQGFIDNTYVATPGEVYGDIYFRQNVGGTMTSRMMIQARSGNVGIGNVSPGQRLEVTGFVKANGFSINDNTTVSGFIGYEKNWIGSGTSARLAIAAESDAINFYTNGSAVVRARFNSESLRFNPDNTAFNMYLWLNRNVNQDGGILMSTDNSLDWQIVNANRDLWFYSYGTGTVAFRVMRGTGNLLINTATDNGTKLLVNGGATMSGGWSRTAMLQATYPVLAFNSNNSKWAGIGYDFSGSQAFVVWVNANSENVTTGTSAFVIAGSGAATFSSSVTATSFFESSDSKIKTLLEDKLDYQAISNVTAKYYKKNGKVELGYFAQDFETLLPSAVSKNEDGLLNLSYREVHTAKIAYLEERIKQLEKKYENN